jgi:hypothetical protein
LGDLLQKNGKSLKISTHSEPRSPFAFDRGVRVSPFISLPKSGVFSAIRVAADFQRDSHGLPPGDNEQRDASEWSYYYRSDIILVMIILSRLYLPGNP